MITVKTSNISAVITKFKADAAEMSLDDVKSICMEALKTAIQISPVDSGLFKNNWMAAKFNEEKINETPDKSGLRALRAGTDAIDKIQAPLSGLILTISNNLPYAIVLDDGLYPNPPKKKNGKTINGYSKQAPEGITRPVVRRFAAAGLLP